jgi:replicative DNA helicase
MKGDIMADDTTLQTSAPLSAPQDNTAEQSVLGSVLISTDPTDTLTTVGSILAPDDFFRTAHRMIFSAMLALDEQQRPIDTVTLIDQLNTMNQLENAGGEAYLAELALAVPIASNAEYYAKIVKEKALRRTLIDLTTQATQESYEERESVEDAIARISQGLDAINSGETSADFKRIADVVNASFTELERNAQTNETVTGLATGYPALDELTTGLHGGQMIVVAARPAVGKTAFVLNIAQKVAVADPNLPVALFSLEMKDTDLVNRMLSAEGNIDAYHMRNGQLEDNEWRNLTIAMGSLANTKIYIDDTAGIKVTEIRSKLRRLQKQEGQIGLVIIDYLQLIEGSGNEGRQQEVSAISRAIKKMAMELNTPVIALSQLSRGVEQRQDKRPILSDIRESGSIEQDADIVAFLYREDYHRNDNESGDTQNDPREDEDVVEVEVILEKNRAGARGTARLLFVKSYNKFSNIEYRVEEPGFG